MRLIDADALIPLIQEDKIEGKILDIVKALGDGLQAETLNQACDRHIKIINGLPTIDAVPVKPGEWSAYEISGYRKCSMCGGYVNWNPKPFLFGDGEYNYCPNCGAKMRQEGDNGVDS